MFLTMPGAASSADTKAAKAGAGDRPISREELARGRYMLIVANCNDCHTAGFAPSDGNIPEKDWLLGSGPLGFRGPWGTTYAPNLRPTAASMTEAGWVKYVKALKTRPPMPWFNFNQWKDADLKALYQYIKHMGPVGEPAKAFLPPDQAPQMPYVQWPAPPK
jgi:mono/diheme cytochrome c family protein